MEKEMLDVLEEHIFELEKRLMTYKLNELTALLADDFYEFGSSGAVITKKTVMDAVRHTGKKDGSIPFVVTEFAIKRLAIDTVLATYKTEKHSDQKRTWRSSIWKLNDGNWQMIFHQGTPTTL